MATVTYVIVNGVLTIKEWVTNANGQKSIGGKTPFFVKKLL